MAVERNSVDKFAFIGPASVGKTTMAGIFRKRFEGDPRVAVIDEGAKIFFENHPDITDRFVRIQEWLQDFVLIREKAAYQPEIKLIIVDRSVIDPIVYTQAYDTSTNADMLLQRVADWLPTYTMFILLHPSGVPDNPRPARLETSDERLALHDMFGEFCVKNGLHHVEVSGTLQERADKVHRVIFERVADKTIFESSQHGFGTNQI